MTKGQRVTIGFITLFLFALAMGMNSRVHAAAAPVYPLPDANWCTSTPIAPGQIKGVSLGPCPAPPADQCPAGRQTVAQVCYRYGPTGCINTDVTKFENIWGRLSNTDPTLELFPSEQVFGIIRNFQKSQYIAAKFVSPAGPLGLWGRMTHGSTTPGPNLTVSISASCGDFTPTNSRCVRRNVGLDGAVGLWAMPGFPAPAYCPLTPGAAYYLNIKMTAPVPASHNDCSGSVCKVTIQNNHTP